MAKNVKNVITPTIGTDGDTSDNRTWANKTATSYADQVAAARASSAAKRANNTVQQPSAQQTTVAQPVQTQDATSYADALAQIEAKYAARDAERDNLLEEYKSLYEGQNNAYTKALQEQQKAIQAGVDQAVNNIEGQKEDVTTQYANTLKQLYLDKMMAQKNIGQKMAAAGQTGGQAETTLLGIENNYANNLSQSEQAKTSALSDLEREITNAQLSGSIEGANAASEAAINSTNAYAQALKDLIAQSNTEAQLEASKQSETKQYAYNLAVSMLNAGSMPSASLLATAGISTDDAQALINQVNAAKKTSGYGSSGTVKEETGSYMTEDQAKTKLNAALQRGTISASDKALLEAYYGNSLEELALSNGWSVPTVEGTAAAQTDTQTETGTGTENTAAIETKYGEYGNVTNGAAQAYTKYGKEEALQYLKEAYNGGLLPYAMYQKLYSFYNSK